MSQHSIFGIEGKIGYFRLIFDQILAENTISNSNKNQKACCYVSFHHTWRYILIVYTRLQNFWGACANFGWFSTSFWPIRPPYTSNKFKTHTSVSVNIIYDLNESYLSIYLLKSTIIPDLSYFGPRVYPLGSIVIALVRLSVRPTVNISETAH